MAKVQKKTAATPVVVGISWTVCPVACSESRLTGRKVDLEVARPRWEGGIWQTDLGVFPFRQPMTALDISIGIKDTPGTSQVARMRCAAEASSQATD